MTRKNDEIHSGANAAEGVTARSAATRPEPQATPGPWMVDEHCDTMIWTVGDPYGHGRMRIADLRGWGHLSGQGACRFNEDKAAAIQDANGRLIAAAPDLLMVLRGMEWLGLNDGRGVTHRQCPACSALQSRGTGHNPYCGLAAAIAKAEGRS